MRDFYFPGASSTEVAPLLKFYPNDPTQGSPFGAGKENQLAPMDKRIAASQGDFLSQPQRRSLPALRSGKQPSYALTRDHDQPHGDDVLSLSKGEDFLDYVIQFIATLDPDGSSNRAIHWPSVSSLITRSWSWIWTLAGVSMALPVWAAASVSGTWTWRMFGSGCSLLISGRVRAGRVRWRNVNQLDVNGTRSLQFELQQLVALTHICQHWRSVALGTPQLWVDATRSVFSDPCSWDGANQRWPKCLPVLLARSEPLPLSVDFSDYKLLTNELRPGAVLLPHISRLVHLCVHAGGSDALKNVLSLVHLHFRNLEILDFPQVRYMTGVPFYIKRLPMWDDAALPRLHTLVISGRYFGRSIAVASLKTLVLYDGPRRHDVFLNALERCGPNLESLTLHDWSHPEATSSATTTATTTTAHLPRLRRLEVALSSEVSDAPPALLFAALCLPADVAIDLDWHLNRGSTLELLPKHLAGLHAPPFCDSMCLHLFRLSSGPMVASLHGYVGATERLCVREQPVFDLTPTEKQALVGRFPHGHRWPASVPQLAVDLDMEGPAYELGQGALEDLLRAFVGAFPGLRRLDLLGRSIASVKLGMVDAFLDLPPHSESSDAGRTLGYICEASEYASTTMVDALRAQLDALEARLTRHLAQGGARLRRLELCIAYSSHSPHSPPRWGCPDIRSVEPSTVLTAYLSSMYLPRFKALADEVVFMRGA
ncbi:hypothetical protein V8D89_002179 [Ganoderma adspersum]